MNANLNNATVLIDGDTLNTYAQRVGEEKAAEKLGVTVETIREAAKKGDTVEVKQGNFESLSASDPSFYQEVRDALSFDVNDISNQKYNQIQVNIENYSKLNEQKRTELKTEVDKIAATLEEAGANKSVVAGWKAFYTSAAVAARPDNPAQWVRDNPLRFEKGTTVESDVARMFQSMKKSKAKTINEFYNIAVGIDPESNAKEYYQIVTKSGEKIDVANDDAIHFIGKHNPDYQELIEVEQNVENIIDYKIDKKKRGHYGGTVARVKLNTPKGPVGATYEFLNNGRTFLTTTFYGTEADIDNWVHKEKEGANRSTENDVPASFVSSPSISSIRKEAFSVKWDKKQTDGDDQFFQVSESEFNRQKEEVRKQYEGTDQWMKAPNGKPTNLTEDQWVTVRTPAFKNWFGDWEREGRKEIFEERYGNLTHPEEKVKFDKQTPIKVEKGQIVAEKSTTAFNITLSKFLEKYPKAEYVDTVVGKVKIDANSVRDSFAHRGALVKADSTLSLVEGMKVASYITSIKDYDNPELTYHYFIYKIDYDGQEKYVLCRVKESINARRVYLHEVTDAEGIANVLQKHGKKISDTLKAQRPAAEADAEHMRGIALYAYILNEFINPVNASKVVDENGEPKVMYHQTANTFDTFDIKRQGAGTNDSETPYGIFMKPNSKDIGLGDIQMQLFSNIRNPLHFANREDAVAWLKENVPGYKKLAEEFYDTAKMEHRITISSYVFKFQQHNCRG